MSDERKDEVGRSARKKALSNKEPMGAIAPWPELPICLSKKRNDGKGEEEGGKTAFRQTNRSKAVDYKALSSEQFDFYGKIGYGQV